MRSHGKRFFSNPGNPLHKLYAPKVLSDGSIDLVESGVENTDDIIQSFAESTDIRLILSRVAQGDYSGLQVYHGTYGDFTKLPGSFAEALQLEIDSNRLFNSLPPDMRQRFDHDPAKFFAAAGSSEWFDKLKEIFPADVRNALNPPDAPTPVPVKPPSVDV